MKILYIVLDSAPYGSNRALLNLMESLVPKGVIPIVVVAKKGGLTDFLEQKKIDYFQLRFYYSIYPKIKSFRDYILFFPILFRTLLFNYLAVRSLIKIAKEKEIDIIHTNIGPLQLGYEVSKKIKIPHVWHIREYQDLYFGWHPLFSFKNFVEKLNNENCYPISITRGLYKHYAMKDNARIIYDGVMQISQNQFIPKKEKYFLFVGRLEEAKGIRQLIETFIEVAKKENEYKLMIAGEGGERYKNKLLHIVESAGMNKRIQFLGFRDDVNALMANATALIVSSNFEGFGFTTVEALFNGCLVVGYKSGGTKEILEQEQIGLLYTSKIELANYMQDIISNGVECYFSLILRAQDVAIKQYSCERSGEEVYKFYIDILRKDQKEKLTTKYAHKKRKKQLSNNSALFTSVSSNS